MVQLGTASAADTDALAAGRDGNRRVETRPTSCASAAPPLIDREDNRAESGFKKAPILGPRSGVGLHAHVGRGSHVFLIDKR